MMLNINELSSYQELQKEFDRLNNNIERMEEGKRNIENSSSLTSIEKENQIKSFQSSIDVAKADLDELKKIQSSYDKIVHNLDEIKNFKLDDITKLKDSIEMLDVLKLEIVDAIKVPVNDKLIEEILIKQGITREYFDKICVLSNDKTDVYTDIDHRAEYDKFKQELNNILGGRSLTEIGIEELEPTIYNKYDDLKEKKKKLKEALDLDIKNNLALFSESEINYLLQVDSALDRRIEKEQQSVKDLKEAKEMAKTSFEEEIKQIEENIKEVEAQITILENDINELLKDPLKNQFEIIGKRSIINNLKKYVDENKDKIKDIKDDIEKLIHGGDVTRTIENVDKIDFKKTFNYVPSAPKPAPQTPPAPSPTSTPVPAPGPTPAPAPAPAAPQTPPAPQVDSKTIDGLIKKGILPNNITLDGLEFICEKLGIIAEGEVLDINAELDKEKIDRLINDHQIQSALVNQKIVERNEKKIAEYDKIISKYEEILNDTLNLGKLSPEYINKVQILLKNTKAEKKELEDRNKRISAIDHTEVSKSLKENVLNKNASKRNDKLREEYINLERERDIKEKANSKFKKRRQDRKIEKVLTRIKKLKEKQGKITSKQTEIINKNSEKYIKKITNKFKTHFDKQEQIVKSSNTIIEDKNKLSQSEDERVRVAFDRMTETQLIDRIASRVEDLRLAREIKGLKSEIDREEKKVGRMK